MEGREGGRKEGKKEGRKTRYRKKDKEIDRTVKWLFLFILTSLLEYNCFTMVC